MILAYEGKIKKGLQYYIAQARLMTTLLLRGGYGHVKTLWSQDEEAPVAQISERDLKVSKVEELVRLCTQKGFMAQRV